MIPFNKPYLTGKEAHYLYQAVYSGKISGNGIFRGHLWVWESIAYNQLYRCTGNGSNTL
jgi:hypothetical protein